jgi:hypothetical protein
LPLAERATGSAPSRSPAQSRTSSASWIGEVPSAVALAGVAVSFEWAAQGALRSRPACSRSPRDRSRDR